MLAVIVVQASPTIVPRGECRGIPPPKTYHNISLHERFYLNHILLIFLAYLHHVLCPPPDMHKAMPWRDTTTPFCEGE